MRQPRIFHVPHHREAQLLDDSQGAIVLAGNDGVDALQRSLHEGLIQRDKPFGDESLPSGNGNAVRALMELGFLLGEPRYLDAAERALRAGMIEAEKWPSAHATLMSALLDHTEPPPRAILRCSDDTDATEWLTMASERLSTRSRCYLIPSTAAALPGQLANRSATEGAPVTAYVYRGRECSERVTSLTEFAENLSG